MIRAYLALGSNLQDPIHQVKSAIIEISQIPKTRFVQASSLYRNPPVGIVNQPDFINAVVAVQTGLSAWDLLQNLLELEKRHFRVRGKKNGPRTLDLDILLYGEEIINDTLLQVPHPRLKERTFVVFPLAQITPTLILPCGTSIQSVLKSFTELNLVQIKKIDPRRELCHL